MRIRSRRLSPPGISSVARGTNPKELTPAIYAKYKSWKLESYGMLRKMLRLSVDTVQFRRPAREGEPFLAERERALAGRRRSALGSDSTRRSISLTRSAGTPKVRATVVTDGIGVSIRTATIDSLSLFRVYAFASPETRRNWLGIGTRYSVFAFLTLPANLQLHSFLLTPVFRLLTSCFPPLAALRRCVFGKDAVGKTVLQQCREGCVKVRPDGDVAPAALIFRHPLLQDLFVGSVGVREH